MKTLVNSQKINKRFNETALAYIKLLAEVFQRDTDCILNNLEKENDLTDWIAFVATDEAEDVTIYLKMESLENFELEVESYEEPDYYFRYSFNEENAPDLVAQIPVKLIDRFKESYSK